MYGFVDNYGLDMMGYGDILFLSLFRILIIAGVYLLIRWLIKHNRIHDSEEKFALEITKVRYPEKEIIEEEPLIGMLT